MNVKGTHWTERSIDDFLHRISSDFALYIENQLARNKASQGELANVLGVSEGRISQVLNNPGNLTLRQIIRYARALGRKVSIVAYDDGDPTNARGPVHADVFSVCWEMAGKPRDFFSIGPVVAVATNNERSVRQINESVHYWDFRAPSAAPTSSRRGVSNTGIRIQ